MKKCLSILLAAAALCLFSGTAFASTGEIILSPEQQALFDDYNRLCVSTYRDIQANDADTSFFIQIQRNHRTNKYSSYIEFSSTALKGKVSLIYTLGKKSKTYKLKISNDGIGTKGFIRNLKAPVISNYDDFSIKYSLNGKMADLVMEDSKPYELMTPEDALKLYIRDQYDVITKFFPPAEAAASPKDKNSSLAACNEVYVSYVPASRMSQQYWLHPLHGKMKDAPQGIWAVSLWGSGAPESVMNGIVYVHSGEVQFVDTQSVVR